MAGGAYETLALWRGQAEGDVADYVIFRQPAEIEISESDDFVPTHEARVATPDGQLLRGVYAIPAVEIGW
ncbi:MAG: hypothetical protein CMM46_10770 [Rhodospirillaceae bacterium]|nr:hypothetical protein [Rhodospirillaceae bacterium]|tara:strand:+ start:481 stop:690 length:210 start_codon:yes stop_codon:yes gene_type:complete